MTSTEKRPLTYIWLGLLAYSGLFLLLQVVILPPLHLPESAVVILCAVLSALPILWYGSLSGVWRTGPVFGVQRPSFPALIYLFSLDLTLNLVISLTAPLIESILRLMGIGVRQVPMADYLPSLPLALYICILGPILEELIYRGVVLRKLLPYGTRLAIVLSAICFGLMHHDFYQGLSAFLGGLVYGFVAVRYSLAASIGLHILNNTIATLLPLLKGAGTAGALATVALMLAAASIAVGGSIAAFVRRRRSDRQPVSPSQPGLVLRQPLLWAVLLFDTAFLIHINFIWL